MPTTEEGVSFLRLSVRVIFAFALFSTLLIHAEAEDENAVLEDIFEILPQDVVLNNTEEGIYCVDVPENVMMMQERDMEEDDEMDYDASENNMNNDLQKNHDSYLYGGLVHNGQYVGDTRHTRRRRNRILQADQGETELQFFSCVLDPKHTPGNEKGITLELSNTDEGFMVERKQALALNATTLIIRGGTIQGYVLILPEAYNIKKANEETGKVTLVVNGTITNEATLLDNHIDGNGEDTSGSVSEETNTEQEEEVDEEEKTTFKPVLEWVSPDSDSPSLEGGGRRNYQFGERSVLVIRVTVNGPTEYYHQEWSETYDREVTKLGNNQDVRVLRTPQHDAATVSNYVFGTSGTDEVNLRSQYKACSADRLDMTPANGTGIVDGVLDINVTVEEWFTCHITNKVKQHVEKSLADGGLYGLDLEQYDHVMFHFPSSTRPPFVSDGPWTAFARKPGYESWYNDNQIGYETVQMHEVGHNLGLHHSGEGTAEYADTTDVMGYSAGAHEKSRCFNAEKMHDLGWFTDREKQFDPARNMDETFVAKLIGVNDYANSAADHTLILSVLQSHKSTENLYMTYNRAEGITADTGEAANKVVIVQGSSGAISWKRSELADGESWLVADFHLGQTLNITITSTGTDQDNVEYAMISIKLEKTNCITADECPGSQGTCYTSECDSGVCTYVAEENCCGNSVCELSNGEHCNNCPNDCTQMADDCFDLGWPLIGSTGVQMTSVDAGNMFNLKSKTDITLFGFEIRTSSSDNPDHDTLVVEVYTKPDTWVGSEQDSAPWTKIMGPREYQVPIRDSFYRPLVWFDLTLDRPIFMPAGTQQAFYVTLTIPGRMWYKHDYDSSGYIDNVVVENDDMQVLEGSVNGYPFGQFSYPHKFIGRPQYYHGSSCYLDDQCDDYVGDSGNDTCNTSSGFCDNPIVAEECGNRICEPQAGETCSSCPSDCMYPTDCNIIGVGSNPYATLYRGDRYTMDTQVHGQMFDIDVISAVTMYEIEIFVHLDSDITAEVYFKQGGHAGYESSPRAWTKVFHAPVTPRFRRASLLLDFPVRMESDTRWSFYVTLSEGFRLFYSEGTRIGNVVKENHDLKIFEGTGHKLPFDTYSRPTKFRGLLHYVQSTDCYEDTNCHDGNEHTIDKCNTATMKCEYTPIPDICGNTLCELDSQVSLETWALCPEDCPFPEDVNKAEIGIGNINSYNCSGGKSGGMFDVQALNNVTIYSLQVLVTGSSDVELEVYTTDGSHEGKEKFSAAWRLVNGMTTVSVSSGIATVFLAYPIRIRAGSVQGFYVTATLNSPWRFPVQEGSSISDDVASDTNIKLMQGSWNEYPFGDFQSPFKYLGNVLYYDDASCASHADCYDGNLYSIDTCENQECKHEVTPDICGNGICEDGEFCYTCVEDCNLPDVCKQLATVSSGASTSSEIYGGFFDIKALNDITVYKIDIRFLKGELPVEIYTKVGSSVESEMLPEKWTLVFNKTVTVIDENVQVELDFPIRINQNAFQGFYITTPIDSAYNSPGVEGNNVIVEDENISVFSGKLSGYHFDGVFNFHKFQGNVYYNMGVYCFEDTHCNDGSDDTTDTCDTSTNRCIHSSIRGVCGDGVCEKGESCGDCPEDCVCDSIGKQFYGTSYSDRGISTLSFEVKALSDVTIYLFEPTMYENNVVSSMQVYTKKGSLQSFGGRWVKIFDGSNIVTESDPTDPRLGVAKATLDIGVRVAVGEKQSFIVNVPSRRLVFRETEIDGEVVSKSSDLELLSGRQLHSVSDAEKSRYGAGANWFGHIWYSPGTVCYLDSECNDLNEYTSNKCINGECVNSPLQSGICGNGACEEQDPFFESWLNCPNDCHLPYDTTFSELGFGPYNSWGGAKDLMFDITAEKDLTIYALHVPFSDMTSVGLKVYVSPGGHVGKESNMHAWTLVFDKVMGIVNQETNIILEYPVRLEPGSRMGFYMATDFEIRSQTPEYASTGSVMTSNLELNILIGTRISSHYTDPAVFLGTIKYAETIACYRNSDCDNGDSSNMLTYCNVDSGECMEPVPSQSPMPSMKPSFVPTPSTIAPTPPPTPEPTQLPTNAPTSLQTLQPFVGECIRSDPFHCGCESVKQADYYGTINITLNGKTCQRWDAILPHNHSYTGDNNYCRNPGNPTPGHPAGAAWCYTTDPNTIWDICKVPICGTSPPATAPEPEPPSPSVPYNPTDNNLDSDGGGGFQGGGGSDPDDNPSPGPAPESIMVTEVTASFKLSGVNMNETAACSVCNDIGQSSCPNDSTCVQKACTVESLASRRRQLGNTLLASSSFDIMSDPTDRDAIASQFSANVYSAVNTINGTGDGMALEVITVEQVVDFNYDIHFDSSCTNIQFNEAKSTEELRFCFKIRDKPAELKLYTDNCETEISSGSIIVHNFTRKDDLADATNDLYEVNIDVKQDLIQDDATVWTYDSTTMNGIISFCMRMDLYADAARTASVNFLETIAKIKVDMTKGFNVATVSTDRDVATNETTVVQVNYTLDSYQCVSANGEKSSLAMSQGSVLGLCIDFVDDIQDVQLEKVWGLSLSQTNGGSSSPIEAGEANGLTNSECDHNGGRRCFIETILISSFFDQEAGNANITANGAVLFKFGRRRLAARLNFHGDQKGSGETHERELAVQSKQEGNGLEEFNVIISTQTVREDLKGPSPEGQLNKGGAIGGVSAGLLVLFVGYFGATAYLRHKKTADQPTENGYGELAPLT